MSKDIYYLKQCVLQRKTDEGSSITVSWIPEKFVKVGAVVTLKDDDDTWVDGWEIISFGDRRVTNKESLKKSQEHKKVPTYNSK